MHCITRSMQPPLVIILLLTSKKEQGRPRPPSGSSRPRFLPQVRFNGVLIRDNYKALYRKKCKKKKKTRQDVDCEGGSPLPIVLREST